MIKTNKKGNKGYIVGYWSVHPVQIEYPRNGRIEVYTKKVTIKSCGKKQMTLESLDDGMMTREFHNPERKIYEIIEDAKIACEELLIKFTTKSLKAAKEHLIDMLENYNRDKWFEKNVQEVRNFIADLETERIEKRIMDWGEWVETNK